MLTNTYGCPLHSKTDYAKADWTVWMAALQNDRLMFREFILPLYNYMNENKWRVPMADTYNVVNQKTRVTSWGRPVTRLLNLPPRGPHSRVIFR
jgi:hypothetical protein